MVKMILNGKIIAYDFIAHLNKLTKCIENYCIIIFLINLKYRHKTQKQKVR